MEKISKSNNSSYQESNLNFARIFLKKIDNKILLKLYKLSKKNSIKNKIEKSEISKTPRNRNIIKLLPIKSTFKNQRKIVPPIKINNLSETDKNINYTQNKPNLSYKLGQFKNYTKLFGKIIDNNRNNILFSKKNNRNDIEVKNNSYSKINLIDKTSIIDLNNSLKEINNYRKPNLLPKINVFSKFFHNETLKNALKQSIKIKTKD